jgi:hypothetical protein
LNPLAASEAAPMELIAAAGEHWLAINGALRRGSRGLPGGDSLARLLVRHGRVARLWADCCSWTVEQDELVRTLPPAEVARRTGRPARAVYRRRRRLRLQDAPKEQTPNQQEFLHSCPARRALEFHGGHTIPL